MKTEAEQLALVAKATLAMQQDTVFKGHGDREPRDEGEDANGDDDSECRFVEILFHFNL
jgi:hypothetical protein